MNIKLDKDYEIKTTLGTIREIERLFDMGFLDVLTKVFSMKLEEQLKFVYAGFKKANPNVDEDKFIELCEDNLGMGKLMEVIEEYIFALQFPGMSEEEVHKTMEKKLQRKTMLERLKSK